MYISEICTRDVVTCARSAGVQGLAQLMRDRHVGDVVVVDRGELGAVPVGIVTDRDIVVEAVAASLDPRTLTAGEIMTRELVTTAEDDDTSWSLKVMRDRGVRRLPVLDAGGEVVGIVALDDLLEFAAGALSDVVQALGTERVVEARRRTTPA
jgi:CBS domain-containing protein